MPSPDRDSSIIRHIRDYCIEVETAHLDFQSSYERFMNSTTYRNAVTMPILQIGELTNHLSDSFKSAHPQIPWNEMRGIRNLFAHQYRSVDFDIVWTTSTEDIPQLRRFCEHFLAQS